MVGIVFRAYCVNFFLEGFGRGFGGLDRDLVFGWLVKSREGFERRCFIFKRRLNRDLGRLFIELLVLKTWLDLRCRI